MIMSFLYFFTASSFALLKIWFLHHNRLFPSPCHSNHDGVPFGSGKKTDVPKSNTAYTTKIIITITLTALFVSDTSSGNIHCGHASWHIVFDTSSGVLSYPLCLEWIRSYNHPSIHCGVPSVLLHLQLYQSNPRILLKMQTAWPEARIHHSL